MTNHQLHSQDQRIGDYHVLYKLGQGGFGDVYLAEQIDDGKQVAIKLLTHLMDSTDGMDAFNKFIHEARMIHLRHPNIVLLHDFGVSREGIPFLVMEYISGGTLRDRHPKGAQVPLTTVIVYVRQVVAALQFLHDHRLVHCDVKPENMLLSADGTVLLSDFGIVAPAHRTGSLVLDNQIGGSLPYMAPERFYGQALRASDQYSLGVVVYEWLCGMRPYEGFPAFARLQGRLSLPSLMVYLPFLEGTVEEAVFRALDDDHRLRFETVQKFADALEEATLPTVETYVPQRVVPASPGGASGGVGANSSLPETQSSDAVSWPTTTKGISRRNVVGGATFALVTLIGGGGAWFLLTQGQHRNVAAQTPTPTSRRTPTPVAAGQVVSVYRKHVALVHAVAWAPDGSLIASGGDDATVQLWKPSSGDTMIVYRGHKKLVEAVAWAPDGSLIASSGFDNTVQVWSPANGQQAFTYQKHTNFVSTVAWSPDSKRIASGSYDNTVQIWNATDGVQIITYQGHTLPVHTLSWSGDGKYIASASFDNTLQVWNATDGTPVLSYHGHTSSGANAIAWSPDSKRIASGGDDKTVQVWESTNGHLFYTYRDHQDIVDAVSWSPDGKRIASGGDDNTVRVWEATNGGHSFVYRQHTKEVRAVAWSPDGRLIASCSTDQTAQVWGAG